MERKPKANRKKRPSSRRDPLKYAAAVALVRGRPNTYYPQFPDLVERLLLLKPYAQLEDLAEYFGCSIALIAKWKKDHPEFLEACARGGEAADAEVAASLAQRARGMIVKKMVPVKRKIDRDTEIIEMIEVWEEVPPDTNAANLWLANRQRGRWSMRPEVTNDSSGGVSEVRIVGGLPDADD